MLVDRPSHVEPSQMLARLDQWSEASVEMLHCSIYADGHVQHIAVSESAVDGDLETDDGNRSAGDRRRSHYRFPTEGKRIVAQPSLHNALDRLGNET